MKNKVSMILISIFIFTLSLFLILTFISDTLATGETHEIYTFDDLVKYAELSRTSTHSSDTYLLKNDIKITDSDYESIKNDEYKYISFGSDENPFSGTFDGNGFTIYNLKYDSSLDVKYDTGLFSKTNNALIKNLTIDNADISSDYRGGIVAGYSKSTTFLNITVKNSHLFVSATNNVLTLITDGGIRGGTIVGEAEGSIFYNCESNNNTINTNNTSGVAALSGKSLTLGGLVGILDNSLIEYSRVKQGSVKNYYDVAVGALGGNTLYVGGIAGKMRNSSQIIDSYSTAQLYYYCATYVSVGAGNSGHIGGISAIMEGSSNEIVRSHYAGFAASKQYNAVLVIPIIQNNINISGIVDVYDGGAVVNSYFKPSLNASYEMDVLGNDTTTSSYGPVTDNNYVSSSFWIEKDYDLAGTKKRTSSYKDVHYNKWVIDNNDGILVHGNSVSATLDFPAAGSVTIDKTNLINSSVTTFNPYAFAVQGIDPGENKINLSLTENEGYKFINWYKVPNVTAKTLEENHEYFEEILSRYDVVSQNKNYENALVNNNDLFVAYFKANVIFHDINGDMINKKTGDKISEISDKDWYSYNDLLPNVIPSVKPESSNAKLIGWTTIKSTESGFGYSSITSSKLSELKSNNEFYEPGDKITKAMYLYPVYVDSITNIVTIFEGHDQDESSNESLRENVGQTSVIVENNEIKICVTGLLDDNTFPPGYKFLGWYDEEGNRVSQEQEYTLKDIDLTIKHTYTAKFEYLVEYYVRAFSQDDGASFIDSELFTSVWQKYDTVFNNIAAPGYLREHITHWGTSHVNHGSSDDKTDTYTGNVKAPLKVYSHNYETATGDATAYQVFVTTDFPGSGQIIDEHRTSGAKFKFTPIDENRYHLLFWTLERKREGWTYVENPMNTGILDPSVTYKGQAFVSTDILFHKKDDTLISVTRRYNSNILLSEDITHTYKYPFMHTEDNVSTSPQDGDSLSNTITLEASPSFDDMTIDGYHFVGFISSLDVEKDSDEWNYIYDVKDDIYTTSNIEKVTPYLVTEDDLVTKTMDLYPVYAKYNVITTTNIANNKITNEVNMPDNPTYTMTLSGNNDGRATVSLSPDLDTYVIGSDGVKYTLVSVERLKEDSNEVIEKNNGLYEYEIIAGNTYTFIANYEPLVLVYHLDDKNIKLDLKYSGDEYGTMPDPLYDITSFGSNYVFKGWSKQEPKEKGYYKYNSYEEFKDSNMEIITSTMVVSESSELWPVYVPYNIHINSNIDNYLNENNFSLSNIRYSKRNNMNQISIVAKDVIDNYYFQGWYENYVSITEPGEMVSSNLEYILENNNMFSGKTYTAVYKQIYEINYYGTDKTLLYKLNVSQGENRSFVRIAQKEDGTYTLTPIDYEVYETLYSSLDNNEIFKNWQWQKEDGSIVLWEDFYDKLISSNMDLYPVINKITAKDSALNDIDLTGSRPDILLGVKNDTIYGGFNTIYNESSLIIHVEEIAYSNNTKTTFLENINVIIYPDSTMENKIGNELTNINGDAIFNFYGIMDIKEVSNLQDEIFVLEIINNNTLQKKKITILNGSTVKIKLPYGKYSILVNDNWNWRYDSSIDGYLSVDNSNKANVKISNELSNKKWFDKSRIKINKFK